IYILRTAAGKEEQVLDFVSEHVKLKKLKVHSIIRAHGMKGYIFLEADSFQDAEEAARGINYARSLLSQPVSYSEIDHMIEIEKRQEINIKVGDIVEIISGPFQREQAKVIRLDMSKEDAVVELVNAAVPIPITLKIDNVKVVRRDGGEMENA
ncbi:MAG TPA: transcription elongation factor Spt5, partial [Candidatus Woesearchaeota archaeon]|nr:transcription elongation factor Spt5 [Candidatus Woesearchaeota archaeon]